MSKCIKKKPKIKLYVCKCTRNKGDNLIKKKLKKRAVNTVYKKTKYTKEKTVEWRCVELMPA